MYKCMFVFFQRNRLFEFFLLFLFPIYFFLLSSNISLTFYDSLLFINSVISIIEINFKTMNFLGHTKGLLDSGMQRNYGGYI